MKILNPKQIGIGASYQLLNACVAPRPIAFVSTLSPDGIPNLAPFSYFMAGGANPPSVVISPVGNRDGEPKDTLRNIESTGEWTVSVVTFGMAERMNVASRSFPYGVSEWEPSGFTPAASEVVAPGFISESPLAIECRLFQVVKHGPGPLSANYCIGEIVRFHVDERIFGPDGIADPRAIDAVSRLNGDWYARVGTDSLFELARPE